MKTMNRPTRRQVNPDPHPDLAEAVTITRFWRNVSTGSDSQCWEWTGSVDTHGYGEFFYQGRNRRAHELALSFSTGEVRHASLDTCHSCDNPVCCNPAHLRFDTRQSNVDEMYSRGRSRHGRLTTDDIVTIRERRALGARQKDLAEQFGVTDAQISLIVRGIRWPDVAGPIEPKRNQYRKAS